MTEGFDFVDDEPSDEGTMDDHEAPTFGDDLSPDGFRDAVEGYAKWATTHYDLFDPVDLDPVDFEVSAKMKRTAGKVGARTRGGKNLYLRMAWGSYEKWGWDEEIEATIRHELIHVLQHQRDDLTPSHNHRFKVLSDKVDATRHCKKFTDFNWGMFCSECDDFVAGKYRKSKKIKQASRYRSQCCKATCYSEEL